MKKYKHKKRRFRYLVNRRFQLLLVFKSLLILFLFALFILFEAYIAIWLVLSTYLSDAEVMEIIQTITFRFAFFCIPIGFVIFLMGIVFTHRIAGPLLKIERTLDEVIEGRDVQPISLRKHDELKSLCMRINRIIEMLEREKTPTKLASASGEKPCKP